MPVPFTHFLSLYSVLPFLSPHLSFFFINLHSIPFLLFSNFLFSLPKLSSYLLCIYFPSFSFISSSCLHAFVFLVPIISLFAFSPSVFCLFQFVPPSFSSPSLTAPRCSILCHFFFYPRVLTSYHSTVFSTQSLLAPSFLWPLCVSFPPFLTLLFPCFLPSQQ